MVTTFPTWMRLLAHRPTRREEALRRSLREQHASFARVYGRCRTAEVKVTFLTDQLTDRTAERDALGAEIDGNQAVYIKSCEESGAALLEYGAEIDLLRHLVTQASAFLPVLLDATSGAEHDAASEQARQWMAGTEEGS